MDTSGVLKTSTACQCLRTAGYYRDTTKESNEKTPGTQPHPVLVGICVSNLLRNEYLAYLVVASLSPLLLSYRFTVNSRRRMFLKAKLGNRSVFLQIPQAAAAVGKGWGGGGSSRALSFVANENLTLWKDPPKAAKGLS